MSLPHKKFFLKISDDVNACDLWFAPLPPIKNPGYAYAQTLVLVKRLIVRSYVYNVSRNDFTCSIKSAL